MRLLLLFVGSAHVTPRRLVSDVSEAVPAAGWPQEMRYRLENLRENLTSVKKGV